MRIQTMEVRRDYPIPCKCFEPSDGEVDRVILGIHGFGGSKESGALTMLAEAMRGEKTALVCFDLPAHGESTLDGSSLTVRDAEKDVRFMIGLVQERYPAAKKAVFATSFGAFLALSCADVLRDWVMVLRAPAIAMPTVLLENVLRLTAEQFRAIGSVRCPFARPIDLSYACYEELLSTVSSVQAVDRSMLIVHGDADEVVPLSSAQAYARLHDGVTLRVIEGANHRFQADGTLQTAIDVSKGYLLGEWGRGLDS